MTGTVAGDLVLLHHAGDAAGGAPWRDALALAGWPGRVVAPDLPGHGTSPAPVGGNYELADPALVGAGLVADLIEPVVAGVGTSGWAAQLLALGDRAGALVLVDGLGGPWREPETAIAWNSELLRTLAGDGEAMAPPPAGGTDPRLRHGIAGQTDRGLALRAAAAVLVPVLVVQTPQSALARDEAAEVAGAFRDAEVVDARSVDEAAVAIVSWAERVVLAG